MAAQIVAGNFTLNENFVLTIPTSTGALATQNIPVPITQTLSYTNGTGALQVDTIYGKTLTLVASTPQTLDLTNLTDPGGNTVSFARVRELIVMVTDTTAGHSVLVSRGASNGWLFLPDAAHALTAEPNFGRVMLADPRSTGGSTGYVTGGSSKTILLDPGAVTITVAVLIVGGSAA